jgi:hypothetical protein
MTKITEDLKKYSQRMIRALLGSDLPKEKKEKLYEEQCRRNKEYLKKINRKKR